MASHMENAAEHLVAAMTADPGSDEAVRHTCAALMFSHAAENYPTPKEN
jgi:ERCC4-related helicase